jgi:hypothetical protein
MQGHQDTKNCKESCDLRMPRCVGSHCGVTSGGVTYAWGARTIAAKGGDPPLRLCNAAV